jgi:hypothetical protein
MSHATIFKQKDAQKTIWDGNTLKIHDKIHEQKFIMCIHLRLQFFLQFLIWNCIFGSKNF